MGEVAGQQVVEVAFVQSVQVEGEIVEVRVHLARWPDEIGSVTESIQAGYQVTKISIWQLLNQSFYHIVNP